MRTRGAPSHGLPIGSADWQSRPEAGNRIAIRIMLWAARLVPRKVLRALLYPVTVWFYVVRPAERSASKVYLNRVFDRQVRRREIFAHFLAFARVTADRFYLLAGRLEAINVRFVGNEALDELISTGRAGLFLTAHFGSFEASRVVGPKLGRIGLRIVLDKGVNARFMAVLAEVNRELVDRIIDLGQAKASLGVAIAQALREGDWVGFPADRHRPGDLLTRCDFLGSPAAFPLGPYVIAGALAVPVVCMFCRLVPDGYEIHCEVLGEGERIPRRQRTEALPMMAQRYAASLERHVRASPFGWFNFFDFWGDTGA